MNRIHKKVTVHTKAEKAFKKFVHDLNEWWPKEYTWSQGALEEIRIDARENGLCTEIGPHGFRCDWGRVTKFVEKEEIRFKWQIGPNREPVPNPDHASDIVIKFIEHEPMKTVIDFEHLNFENHGEDGERYRDMMDSQQGWETILESYQKYCK